MPDIIIIIVLHHDCQDDTRAIDIELRLTEFAVVAAVCCVQYRS